MQLDQNTMLLIIAVVAVLLIVVVLANARRGRATPPPPGRTAHRSDLTTTGDASVEIRLSRLADLRSKGLVSEEEYEAQRSKIIGEL